MLSKKKLIYVLIRYIMTDHRCIMFVIHTQQAPVYTYSLFNNITTAQLPDARIKLTFSKI